MYLFTKMITLLAELLIKIGRNFTLSSRVEYLKLKGTPGHKTWQNCLCIMPLVLTTLQWYSYFVFGRGTPILEG